MNKTQGYLLSLTLGSTLFISVNAANAYILETDSNHLTQSQLLGESQGALSLLGDGKTSSGYIQTQPITTAIFTDGSVNREYSTTLSYSQNLGNQTLHFAGETSPEYNSLNAGITLGNTTVSIGQGSGSENAWLSKNNLAITNDFKQGFTPASYQYQGINLHQQLNDSLGVNVSGLNIDLNDRVDPSVYTAGVNWNNFSANALSTQRNNTTIGKGFSLAYQRNSFNTAFEQYRGYGGFGIKTLQLSYDKDKTGTSYELELASGHSPFNGEADNRMMLTYKKRWGQDSYSLSAAEKAKKRSGGGSATALLLGLGAAAAIGAAGGSSSSNGDGGSGGFATQHEAAFNVLNGINPTSVRENLEYGGWIARAGDNTFSSTPPIKGDIASVNIGAKPSGGSASYHTHAGPDPRFDNENFSPQDLESDRFFSVDGYLGTPAGSFQYHNVTTGEISTIGTIAN